MQEGNIHIYLDQLQIIHDANPSMHLNVNALKVETIHFIESLADILALYFDKEPFGVTFTLHIHLVIILAFLRLDDCLV